MNHTIFARSAAAAAMIGMLSVSAPAFAQSTQGTQTGSNPPNATQSTTTKNPKACKNGKPIEPPPSDSMQTTSTGKSMVVCKADMKKYHGMVKTNLSHQANANKGVPTTGAKAQGAAVPNGMATGSQNGTAPNPSATMMPGNTTGTTTTTAPMGTTTAPAGTTSTVPAVPGAPGTLTPPVTNDTTAPAAPANSSSTTTVAPSTGYNRGTMTNTLRDNPNGPNWLAKFNRPVKASRHHTNSIGTTQPPQ